MPSSTCRHHHPSAPPARPPSTASTRLSVNNCLDEVSAAGANRGAQRNFAVTSRATREQQARDVDAGDEQHTYDGAEQDQNRGTHASDDVVGIRLDEIRYPACCATRA